MSDTGSRWAMGFAAFAGALMITSGFIHAAWGISAIRGDEIFVATADYVFDIDLTVWGWINLVLGGLVFFAGWGVFAAAPWARLVGIFIAVTSLVVNFLTIPYYPVWSLVLVALNFAIIWGLSANDRDVAELDVV